MMNDIMIYYYYDYYYYYYYYHYHYYCSPFSNRPPTMILLIG